MSNLDLMTMPTLTVLAPGGTEGLLRAGDAGVLLATPMELPASQRMVVVLTADEAAWLYNQGRLLGWKPR